MSDKTIVQITEDNIEQLDIKIGTILKDNEGMYWRITDVNDFTAGMRVCDKDGNEIENFVGNAGRSVFGGGLSDLLNDGVTTYFIETKQPEIKKDARYNYFVKDTAEFEQSADFEPITNLTAEEAVSKFYELQKKGFSSGIGINIPNDIVFDDSKGIGSTIVVIDEEKKANFSIFGDSFINNVNIETNFDTLKTRISAYEELYNKLIEQNIPTEYPQFVFEKQAELEKKLESQNYTMHNETISAAEIEEEKLSAQRKIQQLKDELNNPDVNNPSDDQYISETKEYIERLEKLTDEDFKNLAAEKKEQQKKNEETHRRVVEQMAAEKLSREIPQEGELLSYNETHPTYSVVNKETNRQTSIQPRGRLEENVRRLGKLSTLAEARNAIERIKSSGFEILSTESRIVIFNKDKYYDFDSGTSYFNYTTNKFEHDTDARSLNDWDFKDYIKGGFKITKRMKVFEKIESKTADQENENKLNEAEIANKEENPQTIYFNDLSPEQKEEVINGYRSAEDQNMLTEWGNVLRKNLAQIKKDNPFIPSLDIEKEISVAANPPSDEWISEYLQKNKVNFNTDFWQDIFAEMEAKPELKTYHTLKESDVKDLEIVSDEDFSDIVDSIILNDYKNIPNAIRLPNLNAELSEKLGLEKNSAFILKKSSAHIRPDRKNGYGQAFDTEEYRGIPEVIRTANFAVVDNYFKNFQIVFDDKNNNEKINKIVFNKDELGNYLVTVGKVERESAFSEERNSVVAVGVAPTIQTLRTRASSTALRASSTTDELNIAQESEKSSFRTFYEEMNKKPYASLGRYMPTDDELKDYERRQDIKSWDSNEMSEMADYARSQISIGDDSWRSSYMLYLIQNESAKRGFKITKKMKEFEKIGATKENVNKNIEIITSVQGFANLKFSEKPTEEIRNILRENGWYYSRNNNVWYPSVKSKQRTVELSNQFAEKLIQQFAEKPLEEQPDKYIEQMTANGGISEETISMLAEEDEIKRAELYEEEMQDKAEREEEHSEINVEELKARISDWSSEETFEEAEGLSKQEIFEKYGTEKLPIATIPNNFLQLFENGKIKIQDNYVYSSKGFFIDHMVNHHPELDTQDYLAMQDIINNPENVYRDNETGNIVFSQIKNNKNDVVVLGTDNDKLILYRSCFLRRKMPHKYEEIDLQKIKEMSLEGSLSSSIEPSENQKSAVAFSALNDNSNISQLKNLSNNAQSTIDLSGNNIEIPVKEKATVDSLPEIMTEREPEYLESDHSVSGQQILETMQMIAEEEVPEIEENFAYKNQENEETENYITEDELEAFKEIVPLAQYVATLDLITNSEEKEFFIHKVKEIVKNVEAAPKMGKTDGKKEHPLVLKYFHPTGTQALVCEIGKHGEAYGYQILNGDHQMAEWGYINLNELKNIPGMEIDYHIDEGMSIERYLYSENPKEYPQYAELAGNENNEPSVESFNQAEIAKQENFKSTREYEKNHENNTAQNLTENETRRNIMEESLQKNDVLEEQNYGRTGENLSNGTGNSRTEHQILSGSEGKDTGRPYNEGSGSHDMAQFNDTNEASMGRDSGLERSASGSDSLPMDGTSASDEQGNGAGQSEAVSADLSHPNGQISKDIKPDDSTGSNSTGGGNLQAAELEEELRTAHGGTEQLRNGTFVSELTKKEMRDVRSEVKKILESKKEGEEWTPQELALARLYEGGGGLKEKDAASNEILNAYYTPYKIIDAVWKLADSYAPNAVTVLEPSSGIGRFADNRLHNEFTLRELDEISSKLAKVLHPDATVISGAFQAQFFDETGRVKKENYELPKYDLVIGNPPYGENKNEWTGRGEGSEHTRYDQYFIEKALDSLKDENSVLAFVIPSGTLNSSVNRGKELIASKGVLVDAYRLPNNAFPTTQVGTDIVIFKKGAMDVNNLCSNSFFEKHPEKVLGEVSTRSGRFGDEYCVNIPEGETLDTLLTKINSDIKNRGIDLEMIHENQIKNHLERIAEKNRNERNTATASKEKKKKSNIEKLLDEVKKDSLEVVHLYNAIGNGKVKVSKNPLSEIKNDRGRNIYGFSSSYDIETKKAFVTHRDEVLATIDENGIITNAFSEEDFKELSPGKREQVSEYISRASKETVFLNENLLGIHEGKYYLNNAGTRTAYMIHAKLFDSKNKVHLDDFELSNTLVPAITAEKSNLDDFDLRDFRLMNERNSDYGYSRLYKSRLFYPKFETIYPENGNFDFNALLDEISQNEMTIEDNNPVPDFRNTSYEEDEKNLALYREKISSLVLENSSVKSVDEYIQKLKEKNSEISEIRKNRTEKILSERNANQEAENLYGSLYSELSKMNFAKPMVEKFVGSYLVESRQNEKNPYQINVYIDQKRKFSVLQDSSKNVTLVSYNNERLPLSFIKAMYERFGERFSVSDVSPFEEKILSLDDIVKENQKKSASKALCEVAEKSLVEIFSDRELDSELNFEIEKHKARIVQKGTHKQVFFDGSKYAALDFEKITQKLTVNNEVYNSGLQDFVSEKTSELNPDCKVKRDFTINGKRYIDSDGKTKLAPPKSPRYSPRQEELMTNKDFASLYGSKWNEDERIFFEVSDGFGGYINLNRLNEEQQKILRQSKNYVEEYPNKFIHREFYASGNIYKKIDKLEEDFSSGKVSLELYEKNLKILKKAVPKPVRNAEISILSSTVSDYEINGENIKESFLAWAVGRDIEGSGNTLDSIDDFSSSNVKREEIPSTINWKDVYDYVNGIELAKISGDELSERQKNKLRSQKMNDRKLCAEKLFSRFLNEGLSKDEQDRFWNQYNRINHAIRTPDWSKLPLYIEGMNKYRNGVEFKLYDQQIKGVSFLCNKGNGLLAYDVGVGKTAAGIVATVNQIQTGKAKRPLIIVPKTVISQWESDIHELFPDVQVNNLDNLSSRAIANFYDGKHGLNIPEGSITLVTKEALNNISFTESTRDEMLKDFQDLTGVSNEQFSKMSDKEREDYKNKLRDLFGQAEKIDSKDFVFFENCGFDNITVDEAQYYKNLFKVPRTKQANEFAGMGSGKPSKRAVKMFVISQQIQKQNDGRNVFLLSATPFTNSPSEIYSMLIYMARKEMEEQGIKNFYDFCAKHIKTQYEPVVKPNGEIEYANVIKSFNELDALQDSLLSQFIDKVDGEEAGIVRPNKHTLLSKMEATPLQKEIFNFCTNVLMEYDPKEDTNPDHDDEYKRHHSGMILEAINIMRTACLSPALVNAEKLVDPYTENHSGIVVPELDDVVECSPKLKLVCDTVVKNWKENHTHGQLIFMPQGTVAYPKVVEYMVKQGVQKEVFATVDGSTAKIGGKSVKMSKNDEENEQVRTVVAKAFNDRENPCKILIGSDAIKEGINLNGNSIAMYNCMLGWNPSDAIQAEGRVWRQGNRQGDVNIVYPLIYNSVDSLIYQKYDEKKSRIDALWEKSDGEDKKIDLAEINPADLKFDLIKDPVKRAKLELGGEKEKVRQEILNIRNSVLNFEGYVKKLEALTETLQSRREQKADYIANYRNALFEVKGTRTEEEQKKGIERYDASILKAENSIKAMQKKIDGELNKNNKVYTKETFKAEKQNEIEILEKKLKTFNSPEVMQPIIDKYRIKLAEEAVLNLSAEEKNPLDKRIQAVLRPAYFTQWERKNERAELLIQGELDKIDELQKSLDAENESETRQEIKEIKQNIAHLRNENNEFRADWMHKYGAYDIALKFWNETHIEIEPEKEKKVLHNAKVEDVQNETVKYSPKIQKAEKLESTITPPNGGPAASEKKAEPKLTKAELQGYLFDIDDSNSLIHKEIKPAEKAEIKAVEKQPMDISKTDSFTKIDFDFKEEKGFSFGYLKKCGLIPPCKPENNGMVKVMGEDKTEYLMTKRQVSHMVDNAVFHAKNHLQIDVAELSKSVPEYRKQFLNDTLMEVGQERMTILRNRQNENKTELNKSIEQNNVSVSRN